MEKIKQEISSLFELTKKESDIFFEHFKPLNLKKNKIFVEEGKVCNKVGFVENGLMVCVYKKEGLEVVDGFAFENNFITNYYSFLTRTPSEKEIRCIEDTMLFVTTRSNLEKLGKTYPFVERMSRLINEKLFLITHDRLASLVLDSAPARYMKLISQKPDLAQRIPQYLLASYLNVKPETISRIRRKIAQGIY